MKLNERSREYLESAHARYEWEEDLHEWDEITLKAIARAKTRIMDILMKRTMQEEIGNKKDHDVDEREGFNDIGASGISL